MALERSSELRNLATRELDDETNALERDGARSISRSLDGNDFDSSEGAGSSERQNLLPNQISGPRNLSDSFNRQLGGRPETQSLLPNPISNFSDSATNETQQILPNQLRGPTGGQTSATANNGTAAANYTSGYEDGSAVQDGIDRMPDMVQVDLGPAWDSAELQALREQLYAEITDAADVQFDESQTSAGRLDQMLASDSPLMERARTQGMQQANSRGLLNSSMAAGAAQGAMIDRAQPFALQDSAQFAQNARQNAEAENRRRMLMGETASNSFLSNQDFREQANLTDAAEQNRQRMLQSELLGNAARSDQDFREQLGLNEQGFAQDTARSEQDYQEQLGIDEQRFEFDTSRSEQDYQEQLGIDDNRFENDTARSEQDYQEQLGIDQNRGDIEAERSEQEYQEQKALEEQRAENALEATSQEYDLRADELELSHNQALEDLFGRSVANAWGKQFDESIDVVAQANQDINQINLNPNLSAEDKGMLINGEGGIIERRNEDLEAIKGLFDNFGDDLKDNAGVFPEVDVGGGTSDAGGGSIDTGGGSSGSGESANGSDAGSSEDYGLGNDPENYQYDVTETFREYLGRGPGQGAMEHYTRMAYEDGVDAVINDIRNSPEAQVVKAYQDILGRAPDEDSRKFYVKRAEEQGIDQVRAELSNSAEARNR